MNIQLVDGEFDLKDALEVITQVINIKIKYYENKTAIDGSEKH